MRALKHPTCIVGTWRGSVCRSDLGIFKIRVTPLGFSFSFFMRLSLLQPTWCTDTPYVSLKPIDLHFVGFILGFSLYFVHFLRYLSWKSCIFLSCFKKTSGLIRKVQFKNRCSNEFHCEWLTTIWLLTWTTSSPAEIFDTWSLEACGKGKTENLNKKAHGTHYNLIGFSCDI